MFQMDEQLLSQSPERDEILNRYRELLKQSSRLKRELSLSPTPNRSEAVSLATSPGLRLPEVPEASESPTHSTPPFSSMGPQDYTLYEVNQQIKAALTSLLNCESVKSDGDVRVWVQERLMEAEHELKRQRRRRSSLDREDGMKRLWEFRGQK